VIAGCILPNAAQNQPQSLLECSVRKFGHAQAVGSGLRGRKRLRESSRVQHTVSAGHMRHTVIRHHSHPTCIPTHPGTLCAIRRLMGSNKLLGIVHHGLRLLLAGLLLLVGVMGLWRCAIGIERCRIAPEAIAICRCIHGLALKGGCYDRLAGMPHPCNRTCD
jgi:hypothetical protein